MECARTPQDHQEPAEPTGNPINAHSPKSEIPNPKSEISSSSPDPLPPLPTRDQALLYALLHNDFDPLLASNSTQTDPFDFIALSQRPDIAQYIRAHKELTYARMEAQALETLARLLNPPPYPTKQLDHHNSESRRSANSILRAVAKAREAELLRSRQANQSPRSSSSSPPPPTPTPPTRPTRPANINPPAAPSTTAPTNTSPHTQTSHPAAAELPPCQTNATAIRPCESTSPSGSTSTPAPPQPVHKQPPQPPPPRERSDRAQAAHLPASAAPTSSTPLPRSDQPLRGADP